MIAGAFNIPLTSVNRSPKQKIRKETLASNDTLAQMDLTDTETFYPKKSEYIFYSSVHGTFPRRDHT